MNFPLFIKEKTPEKLGVVLAVPLSTIYSWVNRGAIPRDRWPDLMLAFPEVGLRDLLAMEAARKQRA
jgi:hypothetical protein